MTGVVGGTGCQRSPPGLGVRESFLRIQRIKPMLGNDREHGWRRDPQRQRLGLLEEPRGDRKLKLPEHWQAGGGAGPTAAWTPHRAVGTSPSKDWESGREGSKLGSCEHARVGTWSW